MLLNSIEEDSKKSFQDMICILKYATYEMVNIYQRREREQN